MTHLDCLHCRSLRAAVEEASTRLGRPVDSFDTDADGVPFAGLKDYDGAASCPCDCHAHLRIVGRWSPPA